jgi:hypothetical protein
MGNLTDALVRIFLHAHVKMRTVQIFSLGFEANIAIWVAQCSGKSL